MLEFGKGSFSDSPFNVLPSDCTPALVSVGLKQPEVNVGYLIVWKEKGIENDLSREGRTGSCETQPGRRKAPGPPHAG